jgi:hypothetical protein
MPPIDARRDADHGAGNLERDDAGRRHSSLTPPDRSPQRRPARTVEPLPPAAPMRRCAPGGARHRPAAPATRTAALPPTRSLRRQTTGRRSDPCPRPTTPAVPRRR